MSEISPVYTKTLAWKAAQSGRMTDVPCGDAMLVDLRSQTLCLKDSLASGNDRALLHAFEAVARARGLAQLAADAGLDRASLAELVNDATFASAGLKQLIAELIVRWEVLLQDAFPENPKRSPDRR